MYNTVYNVIKKIKIKKNKNKDSKSLTNKQGFTDELKRIKLETKRNRKREERNCEGKKKKREKKR